MNEPRQANGRERLTTDYYRDEFACKCGCGDDNIDLDHVVRLQRFRSLAKRPNVITSGVRCANHNKAVSGVIKNSSHVLRVATDNVVAGRTLCEMLEIAQEIGFKGIGVYPESNMIHLDSKGPQSGKRRTWGFLRNTGYIGLEEAMQIFERRHT